MFKKVGDVVPEDALRRLSVLANDALEKGIPAQLGYGFVVGYSSGYCVKKASANSLPSLWEVFSWANY